MFKGIRAIYTDQTLWQLANSQDIERTGGGGQISSVSVNGVHEKPLKTSGFRDGAPHRRKSMAIQVLEDPCIPQDQINLGQRYFKSVFFLLAKRLF